MKKMVVAVAAAAMLAGCDEQPDYVSGPSEQDEFVEQQAQANVREALSLEEKDRTVTLAELQRKDPSVKDVYFTYDDRGNKEVHVVKEEADGTKSDSLWPLIGGMATGFALASLMNSNGGASNFASSHRPVMSSPYVEEERRRRQNSSSAAYTTMMMNTQRQAVRSAPSYQAKLNSLNTAPRQVAVSRQSGIGASGGKAAGGGGRGAVGVA